MNEDKIMDKINKNLKIIDSLLMENGFYKYISKVVNIEDGTSQLYDNLKQLQQENARLKEKIDKAVEYIKTNCKEWENDDYDVTLYYSLNQNECDELLEILKDN